MTRVKIIKSKHYKTLQDRHHILLWLINWAAETHWMCCFGQKLLKFKVSRNGKNIIRPISEDFCFADFGQNRMNRIQSSPRLWYHKDKQYASNETIFIEKKKTSLNWWKTQFLFTFVVACYTICRYLFQNLSIGFILMSSTIKWTYATNDSKFLLWKFWKLQKVRFQRVSPAWFKNRSGD